MRLVKILTPIALVLALLLAGAPAQSQTKSPCAPGGPSAAYPPKACGLRLAKGQAAPGETVGVEGDGYKPNSTVSIEFRSAPVHVATATTNGTGSFATTFVVPANATFGRHTVAGIGQKVNGEPLELTADITISAAGTQGAGASRGGTLPRTGAFIAGAAGVGVALIAVGAFVVASSRRRRVHTS